MSALYSDPVVRRRLAEYLGGDSLDEATAFFRNQLAAARPQENPGIHWHSNGAFVYQHEADGNLARLIRPVAEITDCSHGVCRGTCGNACFTPPSMIW